MAVFELHSKARKGASADASPVGFGNEVLLSNAKWFTFLRWIVALVLVLSGVASKYIPVFYSNAAGPQLLSWPFSLAMVLVVANVFFSRRVRNLSVASSSGDIERHLWLQIILDLMVLTIVVHFVGSIETYIAFTYLFHIVLACIFFPRKHSLAVTLLASAFYISCVMLEAGGILQMPQLAEKQFILRPDGMMTSAVYPVSASIIWVVVWYLVSTLSATVRARNAQIVDANIRLEKASSEKNQQMLKTTHDLKSPFSGMEINIQMLRLKHWDDLSDEVKDLVSRIEVRSQLLQQRIKEILLLGELRSVTEKGSSLKSEDVNIRSIVERACSEIATKAENRKVKIVIDLPDFTVKSDVRQLETLFNNLVTNAVLYSHEGKAVRVTGVKRTDALEVSIADEGIGISEEALPHIFEEFYCSTEGGEYNKLSSGLGLAIVREIVDLLDLEIRVDSKLGEGTRFDVRIPLVRVSLGSDI